jgi:alpha-L-fucosidase 2
MLFLLGSYAGAGYLLVTLDSKYDMTDYVRWLDLDQALAYTSWSQNNISLTR